MKKFISLLLTGIMALSLSACASLDKEAASAPVEAYLNALKAGDLDTVTEYEAEDYRESGVTAAMGSFETMLESAGMGSQFNTEAQKFMQEWVKLCFADYTIEDVKQGENKDEAQVTVSITGLPFEQANVEQLISETETDMQDDLRTYVQSGADLSDPEKMYGDIGKMVFDTMIEKLKKEESATSTVVFVTRKQADSDTWLIVNALEPAK